jgi:antitoxin (DNA-binding transcriptional repressor) of toxin-antitoxin stability system
MAIVAWRSLHGDRCIAIFDRDHGMIKCRVADAKNKLPELIRAAEQGEPFTICRPGVCRSSTSCARKKPARKKRMRGTLPGKIRVLDPNGWKPMTDHELKGFLAGRD